MRRPVLNVELAFDPLLGEVAKELNYQMARQMRMDWSPHDWFMLAQREMGEVADALLERRQLNAMGEIVQVMAVLIRLHDAIDRRCADHEAFIGEQQARLEGWLS